MKLVQPKAYLVAKTTLHGEGLTEYLEDIGLDPEVDWFPDPRVSDAENLVEAGGRLCYRSWAPWDPNKPEATNPNVTKVREGNNVYLANILKHKHGAVIEHAGATFILRNVSRVLCYSEDTDVLTDQGWKAWPDVTGHEKFATLRPNGELEFASAEEYFKKQYQGEMYHVQSEQIDLLVTPDHRMWVKAVDTQKAKRGEEVFGIKSAKDILHKRFRYQKGGVTWKGCDPEVVNIGKGFEAETFARFLGFWISEGCLDTIYGGGRLSDTRFNLKNKDTWVSETKFGKENESYPKRSKTRVHLFQNEDQTLDEMRETLRLMKREISENPNGEKNIKLSINDPYLYGWLEKHCGRYSTSKKLPLVVKNWSPRLLSILLDAMMKGDGNVHQKNGHEVYYTSSKQLANDVQEIALKLGIAANIRINNRVGQSHTICTGATITTRAPSYIVSFLKPSRLYPHVNHNRKNTSGQFLLDNGYNDEITQYNGNIYCVKVSGNGPGLLYVRRNGKPVWSGNTHELVRHRAGMAYSQESLRYVRLNDLRFWLPTLVTENEEATQFFQACLTAFEGIQEKLFEIFKIDEVKNFAAKKLLTSMFRRLAPIGLTTSIMVTGNFRAWRNVIAQRTSSHAEEEIRVVISQCAALLKKEFPNAFYDMRLGDDGIEWTFEHEKV